MLGKALEKVSRFAFTKNRGDRPDAENVLVILTDGQSDDRIREPVEVAKKHNLTVLVIATLEANPQYLMDLTGTWVSALFTSVDAELFLEFRLTYFRKHEQRLPTSYRHQRIASRTSSLHASIQSKQARFIL
ncbi:hypothetical protein COOONC_13346 [Cooperia oncophora]